MPEQASPRKRPQSSPDDGDSSKRQRVEDASNGDETPRANTTYTAVSSSAIHRDARNDASVSNRYVTPSTPSAPSVFTDRMVPYSTYPPLSAMTWVSTFHHPSDAAPRHDPTVESPERSPVSTFGSPLWRSGDEPDTLKAKRSQAKRTFSQMVERDESPPAPVLSTASAAATQPSTAPAQPRPRRFVQDTAVAKRLFGGISLVTGQSRTSAMQERRAEIEQRARERQQQREEEAAHERKKVQKRRQQEMQRKSWEYRRSAMHQHHDNLIEMANSLHTETEPRIYYRPYELTDDQERQIAQQVRDAYDVRDREEEDFERRYNEWRDRQRGGQSERNESPMPPRRSRFESGNADNQ